jgi:hypothetical protein
MKQKTMLMIGGAIVVYLLWKKSQETTNTVIVEGDEMARASGNYVGGVVCQKNNKVTGCVKECADGSTPIDTCLRYAYKGSR